MENNPNNYDYGDGFYVEKNADSKAIKEVFPKNKPKPKRLRWLLITLIYLAGILLILSGVFLMIVLARVNYEHPDKTYDAPAGVTLRSKDGVENILLFGEDNHKENEHGRSDSIILLTIDEHHRQLKTTSFMRDLYLEIPGYGYDKLNAAYAQGGAALATATIEYHFHINIDSYMIIDFNCFTEMINTIGGIDLPLTYEEIEYINWQSYRNGQTETETEIDPDSFDYTYDSNHEMTAPVHLNGRQALWYARDRDSVGSDFDRTKRQRIVINCLMSSLKQHPFQMIGGIWSVSGYLSTDMDPIRLTGSGLRLLSALGYERMEYRVPQTENYYNDENESGQVLIISNEELERKRLQEFVFEQAAFA